MENMEQATIRVGATVLLPYDDDAFQNARRRH